MPSKFELPAAVHHWIQQNTRSAQTIIDDNVAGFTVQHVYNGRHNFTVAIPHSVVTLQTSIAGSILENNHRACADIVCADLDRQLEAAYDLHVRMVEHLESFRKE